MIQVKTELTEEDIFKLKADYLIFIDETGDSKLHKDSNIYNNPTVYPVFSIAAILISQSDYQNVMFPMMRSLKEKYFDDLAVVLHSNEIRRKDKKFKVFLNQNTYNSFKEDIIQVLDKSQIKIITCSINKKKLLQRKNQYDIMGYDYDFGNLYLKNFEYVLERVGHFLDNYQADGQIICETVGKKESRKLQNVLNKMKDTGTFYHSADKFNLINNEIKFSCKKDNVNGVQIADYCVYPFAKHSKDPTAKNKLFHLLLEMVYRGDSNKFGKYGFKDWP